MCQTFVLCFALMGHHTVGIHQTVLDLDQCSVGQHRYSHSTYNSLFEFLDDLIAENYFQVAALIDSSNHGV